MANFQVPQFIETKPKIIGPLTLQQFFFLAGAGGLAFIFFMIFSIFLAFVLTIVFGAVGIAFAFVKINGQSLPKIFISAVGFWIQPRIYTWQRIIPEKTLEVPEENILNIRKTMSFQEKLKSLAQKVTTGKLLTLEKRARDKAQERYRVIRRLTGEQEIAKKVDYL